MSESKKCCAKPSIHTMDYKWPMFAKLDEPVVTKINRVCVHCYAHWFGEEGSVKQYTRAEWDALLQASVDADVQAAQCGIEVTA